MIDLHCHILPGIDDGSPDLATSLAMARIAVDDGIVALACTPHIAPGIHDNAWPEIRQAMIRFSVLLEDAGIPLMLVSGADIHAEPSLVKALRDGSAPSLNGSRYFLLEAPHHVRPPKFDEFTFALVSAGAVPILTHPERLSWIEAHFDLIRRLVAGGVLMQVTAGSVTGRFGRQARYWAERMLEEGLVHLIATDAHDARRRPPRLAEARDAVAQRMGEKAALCLVVGNPLGIIENVVPSDLLAVVPKEDGVLPQEGLLMRLRKHKALF